MACFLVPVTEAIVTTILEKGLKHNEVIKVAKEQEQIHEDAAHKVPFSRKLGWLNKMLWGGSALLCFEHLWHGEVIPVFPFLSAAGTAADTAEMLQEMSTVGVGMAVLVTAVWGVMLGVSHVLEKTAEDTVQAVE